MIQCLLTPHLGALLLTGKLVNYSDQKKKEQFGLLKKTVGRLGEPVIRKAVRYAMKIMGTQFVMGHTITWRY